MKKVVFTLLYALGAARLFAWRHRQEVRILCYHGVTRRTDRSLNDPHKLQVRYARFVAHLDHLRRRYQVISLGDYVAARREGRRLPDYSVILTFDDGYRNFLTVIAPCLAARRMPASAFLVTNHTQRQNPASLNGYWTPADDASCLSWAEAQRLKQEYQIEFGSHTCSHAELPSLAAHEAGREIRDSQAAVRANLENNEVALAYPYGKYSQEVVEQARAAGYACGLTTDIGINDMGGDLFRLKRILIGDEDNKAAFALRVSGLAQWLKHLTESGLRRNRRPQEQTAVIHAKAQHN